MMEGKTLFLNNFNITVDVGSDLKTKGVAYFSHLYGWAGWYKVSGSNELDNLWDSKTITANPTFLPNPLHSKW